MATLQTIKLTGFDSHLLTNVRYDIGADTVTDFLRAKFAEAAYPDVAPRFLTISFDHQAVQSINGIFDRAINEAITDHREVSEVSVKVSTLIDPKGKHNAIFVPTVTLTTTDPMSEEYAQSALKCVDIDAANLAVDREMGMFAATCFAKSKAQVDINPEVKPWHDLKTTDPDRFYELAGLAYRHFNGKPWKGSWSLERSEEENFLFWVMSNHPDVDAFAKLVSDGSPRGAAATPAAPTAHPNTTTPSHPNTPTTPMAKTKTATTTIPAGYKVAPAAENATPEQIAEQFATQFEKALSATSPSGAKLADCELVWSATTRPNDLPGRIITCKVIENEQTWHTFVFDCKDRHRDSYTMDEGMKFDWLSVDAMIKAFTGQASVLDCVKDACKKRLMGPAAAPAPKAATKTATAAPQPAEGAAAPTEATTPAPMPKAQTKTAPTPAPQTAAPTATSAGAAAPSVATPVTPSVFQTYECSQTPAFYYHLYGEGNSSGIVVIHRETGDVRQHCANQTLESSRAIINKNGMTEVNPIPSVVITALIKEGVIKAPMAVNTTVNNEQLTVNNDQPAEDAAASAEAAAAEQREREEREAAERAEQERKEAEAKAAAEKAEQERIEREEAERKEAEAKAKREAEERAKREAAEKAKREEEERKRKDAEAEAKRKAEEEEAKKRIEEEKQKIAKRNATMTIRHRDYDKIRIEVELQPLTRTGQYFWGDAGTGKTHMAKMLADDFGLKFHYQGVVQAIHDFKGMVDGHGRFHATAAYYAATQGGLLLLDEMDRYPEDALIWLNGLIANRYASFYVWDEELQCVSEQTITAHPDFRVIGTGNTNGEGPTPLYTAAVQLDASTLDRFNFTHVDYDERVELAIAEGDGELVEFIEAFRATVRDCRFNNLVTYRAVETIHVYMKDGRISIKDALTDRIVKGMSTENQRFVANRLGDHVNTTRNKYAKAYCELANENYRSAASKVA